MRAVIPTVIETTARGERSFDIYSRLLRDRIVFVGGEIDDDMANTVTAQLLYLEGDDPEKDVSVYINSPGGSVSAALSMYDTMQYIRPPVSTLCLGMAASAGSLLLTAGAPGKRFALPNSMIMIHQPSSGGMQGKAADLEVWAKEILRTHQVLVDIYAKHTGQPRERIDADLQRDYFMTSEQARDYGLIDGIIDRRDES